MNVIAAIQYALFKHPNSPVFGGTAAARCTAAIRLPDNPGWANKGWWADSFSTQAFSDPSPLTSPGGAIVYTPTVGVELYGGDPSLVVPTENNGRSSLRDNGNRQDPFTNVDRIREPQMYGILMESRVRVLSSATECLYFIGFGRTSSTATNLDGIQRLCGFVSSGAADNWRAVVIRNTSPNDGITPAVKTKDTTLGLSPNMFQNFVLEVSGGGESARWRASTGAWTNNKVPVVATAIKSELHSRPGEGTVLWGAEVRETAISFLVPAGFRLTRLSCHAWRPGFVGTAPEFRKKP